MTELLVGTKKGLFVLEGEPGRRLRGDRARVRGRAGRVRAARPALGRAARGGRARRSTARRCSSPTTPPASGTRRRGSSSPRAARRRSSGSGSSAPARPTARSSRAATPACCSRAATAARRSSSTARSWEHPTRPKWQPGGGGLCLHSIETWPGEPDRLAIAISAAGVWLTDDGGESWRKGNAGLMPALPARGHARGRGRPLRPPAAAPPAAARADLHAVPRRRVPLR